MKKKDLQSCWRIDAFRQIEVASLAQDSCPQLDANYAEDEEDEETEQQDVAQHGQCVQQQHDQDSHT